MNDFHKKNFFHLFSSILTFFLVFSSSDMMYSFFMPAAKHCLRRQCLQKRRLLTSTRQRSSYGHLKRSYNTPISYLDTINTSSFYCLHTWILNSSCYCQTTNQSTRCVPAEEGLARLTRDGVEIVAECLVPAHAAHLVVMTTPVGSCSC